jgi:serine phosphatase RsbU (regulator of sigma subunit)
VQRDSASYVRIAWASVAALAIFLAWLAIDSHSHGGIAFFYAVPIGLLTWWFGRNAGAVAALVCAGLYALGAAIDPVESFAFSLLIRAVAFAAVVALVSIVRKRLLVLEHSAEELEAIRAALTPSALPELPGVDAAAAFVPSELGVSGDFYLLTNGPDGSTIAVVGDVVGHGPAAARLATFVRARLAAFAANTSDPVEILTMANWALIERSGLNKELVSAACLRFHSTDSTVTCALAGHPPPLCLPSLEELRPEGATALLGVARELPVSTADLRLGRSEGVLVYTDGATDVRRGDRLLGCDGFSRLVGPLADLPARALAEEAQQAVIGWADQPISDDFCLLVLRPKDAAAG